MNIEELELELEQMLLPDSQFIKVPLNECGDIFIKAAMLSENSIVARLESPSIDGDWKIYDKESFAEFVFDSADDEQARINEINQN